MSAIGPVRQIASRIYGLRGQRGSLARDLAELYGVETRILKRFGKLRAQTNQRGLEIPNWHLKLGMRSNGGLIR